jgi:hypothetical protein
MVTKAEAQIMAGQFILGLEDGTDLAQQIEDYVRGEKEAYSAKKLAQHEPLMEAMLPIISEALKEIGSYTEYEGRKALALREQQLNRVKAVIEQFGITSIHPEDNSVISAMADALFGAEL